ncbi:hypothetical protein A1351_08575 [Methylosinus sp. R-45379]|nr:hypothetical protein A1351_08575 [Methylosinus sp. R-45379]
MAQFHHISRLTAAPRQALRRDACANAVIEVNDILGELLVIAIGVWPQEITDADRSHILE